MSAKTALDGIDAILAIIAKGAASPEEKLSTIRRLAEGVRNDIQDFASADYESYLPPDADLVSETPLKEAVAKLKTALEKQEYNLIYAHYSEDEFRNGNDMEDPFIRVAFAMALTEIAVEKQRDPNPYWGFIISTNGQFGQEDEE